MTRRRIIAGVILLAAVVVVLASAWEPIAYREVPTTSEYGVTLLRKE